MKALLLSQRHTHCKTMSEGSTPKRIPDTPPRRLSEQTPIAPSAPPFDDGSTNSLLTLDDEVTGVPEDVSRGCVLAIFDAVAFVTACAAGALGAAHVIQLMALLLPRRREAASPAPCLRRRLAINSPYAFASWDLSWA